MVLGGALLAAVLIAWLLGAQLSRLADLKLRAGVLVFTALATQLALFTRLHNHVPGRLILPLQAGTYALLGLFLLLNIRAGRGLLLAVLGLVANVVPILLNGGRMPISLAAWRATGAAPEQIQRTGYYANDVLAGHHTHVAWLGDVFALPAVVPYASALSIGDVLITFGLATFIYRACTSRPSGLGARIFTSIRFPEFRSLILGRTVSKLGDWLTMAAVVTWVFMRTHSTLAVGVFLIVRMLGLIAGGIATAPLLDRVPGFRVLSAVEALRGGLTLLMLPLALSGLVAPVIALICVSAFIGAATSPSASSLVPEVLPAKLLHQGNALHGVTRNIVMVAGTALGALSVGTLGIAPSLILDVCTFALAAALYLRFGGVKTTDEEPLKKQRQPSRRDLLRGLAGNRVLLGLTASFTLVTAATGLLNASLPQFLTKQVAQPEAYGYALAAIGLGLTCGELLTGLMHRERVARRSVGLAFVVCGAAIFLVSQSRVPATVYLLLFLLGASDGSTEIVYDTLFQRQLSRRTRAGTFALASAVQNCGMVVGFLAAPAVLSIGDSRTALKLSAIVCLAGSAVAGIALLHRAPTIEGLLDEGSAGLAEPAAAVS